MLKNITDRTHYLIMPIPTNTPERYRYTRPQECFNLVKTDFKGTGAPFLRSLTKQHWSRDDRAHRYKKQLQFAIPLEYNHRKRDEDRLKRGAVIIKDGEIFIRPDANHNFFCRFDYLQGRVTEMELRHLDPDSITYQGLIPKDLIDPILNGERIMTENMLFETEVIRGPRVEVTVHHRQPIDLDPETTTFQMLRELDLVTIEAINNRFGVTLLEMPPNDLFAQLVTRQLLLDPERVQIEALRSLSTKAYQLFFYRWEEDDKRVLFPTYGQEPGTISYFNGYRDFIRGRETVAKIGKVAKRLSENSSDDTIKSIVDKILIAQLPDDFYLLEESSAIVNGYRNGPNSCTSYAVSHYTELRRANVTSDDYHPTAVYGGESDVKMYVLKKGDRIMARALVVPEKMQHIIVYPKSASSGTPDREARDTLVAHLRGLGYTHDSSCIVGCLLNKIQVPGTEQYVYPYVDENAYKSLVLDDCLVAYDHNNPVVSLNSRLTVKAKAKLIEHFGDNDSMRLQLLHAGHQEGASITHSMGDEIGYLNGSFGSGVVVNVLKGVGQRERMFRSAARSEGCAQMTGPNGISEYVSTEYLNTFRPFSYHVVNQLDLQTYNQIPHPDRYASLVSENNLIELEGHMRFPAEIVTTIDGIQTHLDAVSAYRTRDGVIFVRRNDSLDSSSYLSQMLAEGTRNESEAA